MSALWPSTQVSNDGLYSIPYIASSKKCMLPPLNLLSLRNEELANLAQSLQQLHVSLHKQRTLNNNGNIGVQAIYLHSVWNPPNSLNEALFRLL